MANKDDEFSFEQTTKALSENVQRSGSVAGASYTLVGGIILLGGIGYAFDWWRDTSPWGLIIGLVLGVVVGFYELIMTVRSQ